MRSALAQRELVLLAVALLAGVIVAALTVGRSDSKKSSLPEPVRWYRALAAPYAPHGRRTACGQKIGRGVQGVAHPVLPCGVKVFLSFEGKEVLTQVIDRAPAAPGREFDVTKSLADRIGLHGTQPIRWAFPRG